MFERRGARVRDAEVEAGEGPAPRGRWPFRRRADSDPDEPWAEDREEDDDEGDWEEDDDGDWEEDGEDGGAAGPRPRGALLTRLLLFPVRVVFWFVLISLAWVALYAVVNPPIWTHLLAEEARLGQVARTWRPIEAFPPDLPRAVMAAEDARFCEHFGIDIAATRAALRQTLSGERIIGGSTLTQQVAKNVFLWHDRTWLRKGLEAGFALAIEGLWSKRRIMEVYLNVAEFDTGTFGAEAAARGYFGKPASALTLAQAARLAAVLPDPRDRSAAAPGPFTRGRAVEIADGARTLAASGRDSCLFP